MQQAEGLARAGIDRHAGSQVVIAQFHALDAQVADGAAAVELVDLFKGDGVVPDAHRKNPGMKRSFHFRAALAMADPQVNPELTLASMRLS